MEEVNLKEEILKFIANKPGATKNQVVEHMQEDKHFCTHVTTRKIIDDLIEDEKKLIFTRKMKKGAYHLYINDEDAFNQICVELDELEKIIDRMKEQPISNPVDLDRLLKAHKNAYMPIRVPIPHYTDTFFYYREAVSVMLQLILLKVKTTIHSDIDADIIHKRTIELMVRLTLQRFDLRHPGHFLQVLGDTLKTVSPKLPIKKTRMQIVDNKFIINFIERIENFEKHVLIQPNAP